MIYSTVSALHHTLPNTNATNGEYNFWWPYWQTIRDCVMGEIMIKARRDYYLPKLDGQSQEEYKAYLDRATYYNMSARTVSGLVGAAHVRPPMLDNLPDDLSLDVVTNDGQSFDMFMKRVTREVVSMGRYGVLIDAPPGGGDPYFAGYDTEDIVDWSTRRLGSREELDYVVLREIKRARAPFKRTGQELEETYRVLLIDDDGVYRQRVYQDGNISEGADYEEFTPLIQGRPLSYIPFLFIGPYDFGFDVEKPPLLDIALLNLSHFRSYAALETGRFFTATPIYAVFLAGGGDNEAEFRVGPNVVWQLGQQDKAELIEFEGKGLSTLENALSTKEQQIAALGGKLSTAPRGMAAESPDAILARERSEASFLGAVIATMSAAGSRLLSSLATWRGTPAEVKVTYASEATQIYLDGREIRAVAMLYDTGLMPLEVIFQVFRQNNLIPQSRTFEDFSAMLPEIAPKIENKIEEAEGKARVEAEYAPDPAPVPPPTPAPKARTAPKR